MDELHERFHRLDRIATPDLWREAVGRAAELEATPRRAFSPAMALLVAMLLMGALAGTIAVGGWVNRPTPNPLLNAEFRNGVIAVPMPCGRIVGVDPGSGTTVREVVERASETPCADAFATEPAWAADGRSIAYFTTSGEAGEASEVWVRDVDTGDATLIATCERCFGGLDISPDGSLVTYVDWTPRESVEGGATSELVVARADGGGSYRVGFLGSPSPPEFSPDGRMIAITLFGGRSGIHLLPVVDPADANTVPSLRLLHGPVAAKRVTWSPDAQWLAFDKAADAGYSEIWAVRADGTDATRLVSHFGEDTLGGAVWSADSTTVAYYLAPDGPLMADTPVEVHTATLEGETELIFRSSCCAFDLARLTWSPDGEWILAGVQGGGELSAGGLYLVPAAGGDARWIAGFAYEPAWQPLIEDD